MIEICRQNASTARVFTIGIGNDVSRGNVRFARSARCVRLMGNMRDVSLRRSALVEGMARAADGTAGTAQTPVLPFEE